MTTLERAARVAFISWGEYVQWTFCSDCGEAHYCRARRRGHWLCIGCFDQR